MSIRFCLLVLCCLAAGARAAPAPSTAANPAAKSVDWYSVEVLVFRYVQPAAIEGESWPPSVPAPSLTHAIYPSTAATGAYAALAKNSALVSQAEARLATSGNYAVLAKLAWRQPATPPQTVSIAPLPASLLPAASATAPASALPAVSSALPASAPNVSTTLPSAASSSVLSGTARLDVANSHTYVTLNLRLCEPAPPGIVVRPPTPVTAAATFAASAQTAAQAFAPTQPATPCFALSQSQEVTPGQFQYFDSPIFGALVLVQSITPPEAAATAPRAASAPGRSPAPGSL